jgi:hypothetical protein
MAQESREDNLLAQAHDLLEYIFLLGRPLTKRELKKVEALVLKIEKAQGKEREENHVTCR